MTTEQAQKLFDSGFWENLSFEVKALFQIFEDKLCMPFNVFHEAVEKTIGQQVQTIQFSSFGVEELRDKIIEALINKNKQGDLK